MRPDEHAGPRLQRDNSPRPRAVTGPALFLVPVSSITTHSLVQIVAPLVGLAVLAVLLAGCGGKSAAPGVANIGTTTTTGGTTTGASPAGSGGNGGTAGGPSGGALRLAGGGKTIAQFSSCMRSHGEPNFPDPDAQGNLNISPSAGIDPRSPQFQAAQKACVGLLPGKAGPGGNTKAGAAPGSGATASEGGT